MLAAMGRTGSLSGGSTRFASSHSADRQHPKDAGLRIHSNSTEERHHVGESSSIAELQSGTPARAVENGGDRQNALKVMMVRVSLMPGMVCTFSLTKWPMSVSA